MNKYHQEWIHELINERTRERKKRKLKDCCEANNALIRIIEFFTYLKKNLFSKREEILEEILVV